MITDDAHRALLAARYRRSRLYDEPEHYDIDYAGYIAERPFYRMLASEHVRPGEAVVELGAGTGRLVLPLAAHGHRVHAVEPSAAMRELLVEKLRAHPEPRVTVEGACATTFAGPADAPVRLVTLPFNAVLHLETKEALLAAFSHVRERLADDGCFALDLTSPSWQAMSVGGLPWGRVDVRTHPTTGMHVFTFDMTRYLAERRVLESCYRFLEEQSDEGVEVVLEQRMWTWQEIMHALTTSGFAIDRAYGDVDFAPFRERSPRLLVAAIRR